MVDIFLPTDVSHLLRGKSILFIGDSNIRGLYKDLIYLFEKCSYIPQSRLKAKLESSFCGDHLVDGEMASRGRDYREVRQYCTADKLTCICFMFCTRVYSDYMKHLLERMQCAPPDLIVVNSCVWDISRWGPRGVDDYKVNLRRFLQHVQTACRPDALVLWLTTLPVSSEPRGGFLIKQVEFLRHTLRFDVMEANQFCAAMVQEFGYDVLDIHYHFRCLIHHRNRDGIHWRPPAVRTITNLLLTHVSVSWDRRLPLRGPRRLLQPTEAETRLSDAEIRAISGLPLTDQQLATVRNFRRNLPLAGGSEAARDVVTGAPRDDPAPPVGTGRGHRS